MAFNGSGVHNRVHDWTQDLTNTIPVTASRMDAEQDDTSTALSLTICRDGQSTTTARIPFASGLSAAAGSASSVSYSFSSDNNTGIYSPGADQVGLVAGGTEIVTVTSSGISITGTLTPSGQIVALAGTVGAPGISFASDLDCGLYRIGANNIGVSVNGAKVLDIGTAGLGIIGTLSATSDVAINTNKFTVTASSGNTLVAGTLAVTGAATLSSTLAAGETTITGGMTASGAVSGATVAGDMVASQAEMETATATNKLVTAGRTQYHPGVAKAWVAFVGADATVTASHNITSVSRGSTGNYTITIATDFSGTGFVAIPTVLHASGLIAFVSTRAAGTIGLAVVNTSGAAIDPTGVMVAFFGDQ